MRIINIKKRKNNNILPKNRNLIYKSLIFRMVLNAGPPYFFVSLRNPRIKIIKIIKIIIPIIGICY
jgi:hypothetical protein